MNLSAVILLFVAATAAAADADADVVVPRTEHAPTLRGAFDDAHAFALDDVDRLDAPHVGAELLGRGCRETGCGEHCRADEDREEVHSCLTDWGNDWELCCPKTGPPTPPPTNPPTIYCHPDGSKCGTEGTTHDDVDGCNTCCQKPIAEDEGVITTDLYCKCLPAKVKCGSTLVTNQFDKCDECCNPGRNTDDGFTYDNYHCN